jgi:oxygen-independent coproporphyrinogen-3 oxidase
LTSAHPAGGGGLLTLPPLTLYVHIPWCVRKCPYCDFNSHAPADELPEAAYVDRLLEDLECEIATLQCERPLTSVFIGGGTPSLFSGTSITRLMRGIGSLIGMAPGLEITLEANPGVVDAGNFAAYGEAGVNRLSIGAQSFSAGLLQRLGRIHDPAQARSAVDQARQAGFANLNLDLMYGLPGQTLAQASLDLAEALALEPEHLSYYELTLEPNTAFHRAPPRLPDEDSIADMHLQGMQMLRTAGFGRYEVSAYARAGYTCRHNLNYWRFGDYIGIGAGAHGKLTNPEQNRIERRWKIRSPAAYLGNVDPRYLVAGQRTLSASDLVLEFALNALRLPEGFDWLLFERRTGLGRARIAASVEEACAAGLLLREEDRFRPTDLGQRFLNDLLQLFDRL